MLSKTLQPGMPMNTLFGGILKDEGFVLILKLIRETYLNMGDTNHFLYIQVAT